MFIWTRVKLSNQVGARLQDEILLLEKQLGCKLTTNFGLDPYIIGYLAVTASILVAVLRVRPRITLRIPLVNKPRGAVVAPTTNFEQGTNRCKRYISHFRQLLMSR